MRVLLLLNIVAYWHLEALIEYSSINASKKTAHPKRD